MTKTYRPQKIVGGGSRFYLFGPDGRLIGCAHEDDREKMKHLSQMADTLNRESLSPRNNTHGC